MESRRATPIPEIERVESLAADAVADAPLTPAAAASLERAVQRLSEAIAASDDEVSSM